MSPEEKKLFDEFKVVVESVEAHTYEKYIKPELDKYKEFVEKTRKEVKMFTNVITLEFFIILLLLTYKDLLHFFKIPYPL